jgi:hypothetical protein
MRGLITRSKMKAMSDKRKAKQAGRAACVRITMARANYRCEPKLKGICEVRATDTHEYCSRAQGGDPNDPDNTFATCRACHDWIHTHPFEAADMGLLRNLKREAQRHG